MTQQDHDRGVELIRSAFELARNSGSAEWQTMTVAVLKNRLLDLTEREFKESDWAAGSFREFIGQFDDVVAVDTSAHPPSVTLLNEDSTPGQSAEPVRRPPPDLGPHRRIRKDLWEAVLNYSAGVGYAWDGQRAVMVVDGAAPGEKMPMLPTLSQEDFRAWRKEFIERRIKANPGTAQRLGVWLEEEQPMTTLPPGLRVAWVVELKGRVLEHLQAWFRAEGIPEPPDITVGYEPPRNARTEVDALRERVLAAVREMSQTELEALPLPVRVLLRNGN